jgi:hypothetical protein
MIASPRQVGLFKVAIAGEEWRKSVGFSAQAGNKGFQCVPPLDRPDRFMKMPFGAGYFLSSEFSGEMAFLKPPGLSWVCFKWAWLDRPDRFMKMPFGVGYFFVE